MALLSNHAALSAVCWSGKWTVMQKAHRPAIRALLHVRHVEHIGWNRLNHQTVHIVRPDVIRTLPFLKTTVTSFFRPSLDFAETAKISELILCFRLETRWRSWSLFRPLDHIYNSCDVIGKLWQCAWTPAGNYSFGPPFQGGTANIDSEGEGIMLPSISVTALGKAAVSREFIMSRCSDQFWSWLWLPSRVDA